MKTVEIGLFIRERLYLNRCLKCQKEGWGRPGQSHLEDRCRSSFLIIRLIALQTDTILGSEAKCDELDALSNIEGAGNSPQANNPATPSCHRHDHRSYKDIIEGFRRIDNIEFVTKPVHRRLSKRMADAVINKQKIHPEYIDKTESDLTTTYREETKMPTKNELATRRKAPLTTPSDIDADQIKNISGALNALLADTFALYLKTKNFHWHLSGPHFRDYHLLLDEHGDQIYGITDDIAERVRKIGGTTIRPIGHIARLQRIADNDAEYVDPIDMLSELREDNKALVLSMRAAHDLCDEAGDVATTSLLENWIDEAQRRIWFLFETTRKG